MIKYPVYVICGEDNSIAPYPVFNVYTAHETREDAINQLRLCGFYEVADNVYMDWDDEYNKEERYIKRITMVEENPYYA